MLFSFIDNFEYMTFRTSSLSNRKSFVHLKFGHTAFEHMTRYRIIVIILPTA
jgi:hypothetical protein